MTLDKMCFSRYEETILDKNNNGKVDNIDVKEIEIETSDKQEIGSENMKSEGLKMDRIDEKESKIENVESLEKDNWLNNEDLIREEPIKEANKEGEIIQEVPKLENLIENDLEKGKSE